MSDENAVYLKIEQGKEAGQIEFTLQTFNEGNLIDIEDADDGPVGVHGVYAFILMNALASDKGLQTYMENLLSDFSKYVTEQQEGEHGKN